MKVLSESEKQREWQKEVEESESRLRQALRGMSLGRDVVLCGRDGGSDKIIIARKQ